MLGGEQESTQQTKKGMASSSVAAHEQEQNQNQQRLGRVYDQCYIIYESKFLAS